MIIDSKNGKYILIFTQKEKQAIINAINYIMVDLIDELSTRTGYTADEYKNLLKKLDDIRQPEILFENTYLIMILQALNEVLHGISIPNFIAEIGIPKAELKNSFNQLSVFLR